MNLQSLQYFEKLIELQNYSSVADYFNVYQSTVSMGIRRLEKDLGCRLVIHNFKRNELILTSAGKALHKYAKVMVGQLPLINNDLKKYQQQLNLELGMPPMVDNTYFPKIAMNLSNSMLLNLKIVDRTSKELLKLLKRDELNIAVVASVKPIKLKDFHSEILAKDKFKLIVSKQSSLVNKKKIKLKDLDSQKVIQMDDGFIQADVINEIKKKYPDALDVIYRTKDPELIKELVSANVGISMLLGEEIDEKDDLLTIDLDCYNIPDVYISLIWRTSRKINERTQKLINTVVDSIKVS